MTAIDIPAAELVQDMEVYPRHEIDSVHIANLVQALQAGVQLPPIVIDSKSKLVIDGWHRLRAHIRQNGPTSPIACVAKLYRDRAAQLLDAVELNSSHGRRLDAQDRARCVLMLEHAGVKDKRIAIALKITENRVELLRVKVAIAPREMPGTVTGAREVPLKRPAQWMAGQKLTKEQVEVHSGMPGTSWLLVARQLTDGIIAGMVPPEDLKIREQFEKLQKALEGFLV